MDHIVNHNLTSIIIVCILNFRDKDKHKSKMSNSIIDHRSITINWRISDTCVLYALTPEHQSNCFQKQYYMYILTIQLEQIIMRQISLYMLKVLQIFIYIYKVLTICTIINVVWFILQFMIIIYCNSYNSLLLVFLFYTLILWYSFMVFMY